MLSFAEKRELQRIVQFNIDALDNESGTLSFKEKRETQKKLEAALAKLEGTNTTKRSSKFDDLVSGKFNSEPPLRFLAILQEIIQELDGDIEPVKAPALSYLTLNQGAILESAGDEDTVASVPDGDTKLESSGAVRNLPDGNTVIDIDCDFDAPNTFRGIIQAIEQGQPGQTIILKINSRGGRGTTYEAFSRWWMNDTKGTSGVLYATKEILKSRFGAQFTKEWTAHSGAWWHISSTTSLEELHTLLA